MAAVGAEVVFGAGVPVPWGRAKVEATKVAVRRADRCMAGDTGILEFVLNNCTSSKIAATNTAEKEARLDLKL